MMLREWLDREGIKVADFATRIGRTAESVRRYASGERIPDRETMPLVIDATQGAVMPNDFFGVTADAA